MMTADYIIEYQEFDGGEIELPVRIPLVVCPVCGQTVPETSMTIGNEMCVECVEEEGRR